MVAEAAAFACNSVAGEFGGLGLFVPGHTWIGSVGDAFGAYQIMNNSSQLEVGGQLPHASRIACITNLQAQACSHTTF